MVPKLEKLDKDAMAKDARTALDKLNMSIDEYLPVAGLPVGYMQFIEIAREIDKSKVKLLILDEPTAVLTETEAKQFLDVIQRLSNLGISILFISHRLDEIKQITDSITILRDGEVVKTIKTDEITIVDMARLMVGRNIEIVRKDDVNRVFSDDYILELENLRVNMPGEAVKDLNLKVKKRRDIRPRWFSRSRQTRCGKWNYGTI